MRFLLTEKQYSMFLNQCQREVLANLSAWQKAGCVQAREASVDEAFENQKDPSLRSVTLGKAREERIRIAMLEHS